MKKSERVSILDIDNMTYKLNESTIIFFTSIENAFKIMDIVNSIKIKHKITNSILRDRLLC